MRKFLKERQLRRLLPVRDPESHKGQNGKVLIVGGSTKYFGAPILSALGALNSGADLVYLYVPECNFDGTREYKADFIVRKYKGDSLNKAAVSGIVELGKECDSVLIGPGIGDSDENIGAALDIIKKLHISTVLDSSAISALKKINKFPLEQPVVITPHKEEFRNLLDKDIEVKVDDPKSIVYLRSLCMDLQINVLLKGKIDFVSSYEGLVELNRTGNAGMTVGGSGDVLAGVVASMMAQGVEGFDAAKIAAYFVGKTGDMLAEKKGYNFTATEITENLGFVLA